MFNSNLAYEVIPQSVPKWEYIITETSKVFRLTENEKNELSNSITAQIIAAIPFAAGCNNPERIAISHIGVYLMEKKGFQEYCSHLPADDSNIYNRLERISHFDGGDLSVINHGMAILALIMLEGYKRSSKKDSQLGIYNPIANGIWNYRIEKNILLGKINEISNPILDSFYLPQIVIGGW